MTSVLFILKIVGVLISGVTTLVALFRSKSFEEIEIASPIIGGPKRIERRITKEGKIAAMLAIVGIATLLLAQIIEQSVNNGRNAAAQAVTSDQLRRTEESLNYLERLGTRFDTLSFTVIYKLKTDNKDFALLENFFSQPAPDRSINPPSANTNLSSGSFLSTNWFSHLLNFSASKESASTQTKHKVD